MNRREFLAASGILAAASRRAVAQSGPRKYRVAMLPWWRPRPAFNLSLSAFRERMAEHGFVEGKTLEVRVFDAGESGGEQFPETVRQALAWNPDAIQVSTTPGVRVVRQAAGTIPIIFTRVNDPVVNGLVASIARPGANVTGVMVHHAVLTSKRLEFVRDAMPRARRVALIVDHSLRAFSPASMATIRASASRLGILLEEIDPSREPGHLAGAFERAAELRVDAVVPVAYARTDARDGPGWPSVSAGVLAWQRSTRLPVISGFKEDVEDGYFASVGSSRVEEWQLAADLTAGILRGDDPATLAVQQLSRIEVAINLRTARELGISIPKPLMLRADKVVT